MTDTQQWQTDLAEGLVATVLDEGAALQRWLDVGFGDGAVIEAALEAGVERVDGVDPDPDAVRRAAERFDRSVVGLRIGAASDLAGFIGPYDVAVSALALNLTDDPVATLRAMRDVLSYGSSGWVVVRETVGDQQPGRGVAGREDLRAVASEAGWTGEVRPLELDLPFPALVVTTEP